MEFGRNLCVLFLVCLSSFLSATQGYKFYVGGRDGWVLNPSENYNHWAERNRFQVNDTLYFKYNKGSNSVLVVNKDNFFNCNTSNPLQKLEDGNSEFKFDRSGAFYFISGQDGNCAKGQKLIVIVLAVRNRQTPPAHGSAPASPPSQGSAPASAPSQGSAPASAPSQATAPASAPSQATAPASAPSQGSAPASAPSQATAPASAPSQSTAPASAPSQGLAPAASPSHAPSTSPTTSPVPAPAAETPTSSPPSASPPVSSPPSPVGETPSPSGEAPSETVKESPPPGSNQDSTAPKGNGSYGVTASSVSVSSVIVLASLALMSTFY